jgi:hypothetical protein
MATNRNWIEKLRSFHGKKSAGWRDLWSREINSFPRKVIHELYTAATGRCVPQRRGELSSSAV